MKEGINILDVVRGLIQDLRLTDEERLDMTLEMPEASIERLVKELKKEFLVIGSTMENKLTKEDLIVTYPTYGIKFDSVHLEQGTLYVKHSNKFALYPNVNEKEYR